MPHLFGGSLEEDGSIDLLDGAGPRPDLTVDEELGSVDVGAVDIEGILGGNLESAASPFRT